mmetsp:Transcript_145501/g.378479  ORF Transcript_145501/g.378479 Transcript_145501/m.378479 type:complete len:429 (-) Transcript_145501:380-1666(-)
MARRLLRVTGRPDLLQNPRDITLIMLWSDDIEHRHEAENCVHPRIDYRQDHECRHPVEKNKLAELHHKTCKESRHCTSDYGCTHSVEGIFRPLAARVKACMFGFQVHVAQVDHVINSQTDDDGTGNALTRPKGPAHQVAIAEHTTHDHGYSTKCHQGHVHVSCCHKQYQEGNWKANSKSGEKACDEALTCRQDRPINGDCLQDAGHTSRGACTLSVQELLKPIENWLFDLVTLPFQQRHLCSNLNVAQLSINKTNALLPCGLINSPRTRLALSKCMQFIDELCSLIACIAVPRIEILNEARNCIRGLQNQLAGRFATLLFAACISQVLTELTQELLCSTAADVKCIVIHWYAVPHVRSPYVHARVLLAVNTRNAKGYRERIVALRSPSCETLPIQVDALLHHVFVGEESEGLDWWLQMRGEDHVGDGP